MKYMRMNLDDKRSRSKASSASRLSPNNLAFSNMEGFIFCVVAIATQSLKEETKGVNVHVHFCQRGKKLNLKSRI